MNSNQLGVVKQGTRQNSVQILVEFYFSSSNQVSVEPSWHSGGRVW